MSIATLGKKIKDFLEFGYHKGAFGEIIDKIDEVVAEVNSGGGGGTSVVTEVLDIVAGSRENTLTPAHTPKAIISAVLRASNLLIHDVGGVSAPGGLANPVEDADGNFYIPLSSNCIVKVGTDMIVSVYAGIPGSSGNSGNGGQATAAKIQTVNGMRIFGGYLYFADSGANTIRRINMTTGVITLVAGDGTAGYSGDNGQGSAAKLSGPVSLDVATVSGTTYVYIADQNNYVIRKVNMTSGVITTVAGNNSYGFSGDGGAAIDAQISAPNDVVAASNGDFYIADAQNCCVRKVTAGTGFISTFAGQGTSSGNSGNGGQATAALMTYPATLALTSTFLYVGDAQALYIRKVDLGSGVISAFAGAGTSDNVHPPFAPGAHGISAFGMTINYAGDAIICFVSSNDNVYQKIPLDGVSDVTSLFGVVGSGNISPVFDGFDEPLRFTNFSAWYNDIKTQGAGAGHAGGQIENGAIKISGGDVVTYMVSGMTISADKLYLTYLY